MPTKDGLLGIAPLSHALSLSVSLCLSLSLEIQHQHFRELLLLQITGLSQKVFLGTVP